MTDKTTQADRLNTMTRQELWEEIKQCTWEDLAPKRVPLDELRNWYRDMLHESWALEDMSWGY